MAEISPHAIVECPANLADGVVVGPFAYVGPDVRIGPGTRVDNNVSLQGRVQIGRDNHIHPFAAIGQSADGAPPGGGVILGDRNHIREHVVICAGSGGEGSATRIGSDNLIMIGSYVGPDAVVADQVILGNYTQLARGALVEQYVRTSGFTGTRAWATIGAYTFTSGYAGVDHDAPPYAIILGFPFKVRGVNSENLERCGFPEAEVSALKDAFRALYNGTGGEPDAAKLKELSGRNDLGEHVRYLVGFLARSSRRPPGDEVDTSPGQSLTGTPEAGNRDGASPKKGG